LQNQVVNNIFSKDKTAIRLWSRKEQPADWGYAKYRDTRSANYVMAVNSFNNNSTVFDLSRSDSLLVFNNSYFGAEKIFKIDSTVSNLDTIPTTYDPPALDSHLIPQVKSKLDPFAGSGKLAGRKNIMITEWGPFDFRSPIIWNVNPTDSSDTMQFNLLGPRGRWVIRKSGGLGNFSSRTGTFPATITAVKEKGSRVDIEIELEYVGEAITTPFGEKVNAGKPYKFYFKKFFQPMDWEVLFFSMDTTYYNPLREEGLFPPNAKYAPIRRERVTRLDYAWWGGIKTKDQVYRQFITIASTRMDIPPGDYELSVTWDDAVRIYMDDRLLLDEWNPSLYKFDESPNKRIPLHITGPHDIRVEHLELGGFATLSLKLQKIKN
jgi:hypothetical protein